MPSTEGGDARSHHSLHPAHDSPITQVEGFSSADGWLTRTDLLSKTVYWGIHASILLVLIVGAPWEALALCAVTFAVRMFALNAGYHRYFSHRSFRTSRAFQFLLAFVGAMAVQKGPLWWASVHRRHHRDTDRSGDPHSPREGFWHAHQGWIFESHWGATSLGEVRDFAKYPELVWLNQYHFVAPLLLAGLCFAIGGFAGLVWGFSVSTVIQWHSTYAVNSLAHRFGSRRYETGDDSRNLWWLALITLGEGWHNNHHHCMASARTGFLWWEVDLTWYALRGLSALGLVWGLREPSAAVLARRRSSQPSEA